MGRGIAVSEANGGARQRASGLRGGVGYPGAERASEE